MIIAALVLCVTGFVDLHKAVAAHPLYPVIAQYDREIATLRSTLGVRGLEDVATSVRRDANALRADADAAARGAQAGSAQSGAAYRTREQNLLAGLQAPTVGQRDAGTYREQAVRSAEATLTAYRAAMAQRTQRALAARKQQFAEKESTLAFDLEKREAGERLLLQLKLRDLYLDRSTRAQLTARLDALAARVRSGVAALRQTDAAQLAAYGGRLRARESADDARMATETARATAANLADRRRISESLPPEAAVLRGYDPSSAASAVTASLERAGRDLGERFAQLQSVARTSHDDTLARIAAIEATRRSVYDAIVAQVRDGAQRVARERHIATIGYGTRAPKGAVDLTPAIPAQLRL